MANENNQNVMQELEQVNDKIDRIGTNLESFIADVRQNYVTKKELNLILDLIRQEIAHLQEGQKKDYETFMHKVEKFGDDQIKIQGRMDQKMEEIRELFKESDNKVNKLKNEQASIKTKLSILGLFQMAFSTVAAAISGFLAR